MAKYELVVRIKTYEKLSKKRIREMVKIIEEYAAVDKVTTPRVEEVSK